MDNNNHQVGVSEALINAIKEEAKYNEKMAEAREKYFSDNPPDESDSIYFQKYC